MTTDRISVIPDCVFRLDGGAMFGVVPRVLWEKVAPPDELNRIMLSANCVLIETGGERILVETGMGEKWTPKERSMYGIERTATFAEALKSRTGFEPSDITIVVNTHLHFDHAGGNTNWNEDGRAVPQFPNARYLVSKREFGHAESPHERDRASYRADDWRPLVESGQLELMPDDYEVVPNLILKFVRGHGEAMQCWRFDAADGRTYFGLADLVPTTAHLPLAWVMGYDLHPAETVESKKHLLPRIAENGWECVFYHDVGTPVSKIIATEKGFKLAA